MRKVHQRIEYYRKEKNFTQEHMAAKLKMAQNSYSKLENGHTAITTERLKEISDILEVPIEKFLTDDLQNIHFNNSHIEIGKFYGYVEHLQEEHKEMFKTIEEVLKYLKNENAELIQIVKNYVSKQ